MSTDYTLIEQQQANLEQIFRAALQRVHPHHMIRENIHCHGSLLNVEADGRRIVIDLDRYKQIFVLGAGKATAPMAKAMEEVLGNRLSGGLIVVKYGHTEQLECIETVEAGHPVPDEQGVIGARRLMELAQSADNETLVINLISGGGSALLPAPPAYVVNEVTEQLTLEDKQQTTQALLESGAEITEINCVRKHLSSLKGGRLLQAIAPARSLTLILSDVVGDDLASIASGLTVADPTYFADAVAVIERYHIQNRVPRKVMQYLEAGKRGEIEESLKDEGGQHGLNTNVLLGTNRTGLEAAAAKAESLGYTVVKLTSRVSGEAKEVGRFLSGIAADNSQNSLLGPLPLCIISGGEPVVTITGNGKGGRNQEMALAFLLEMEKNPQLYKNICFLAASTDGNDGPTDAAGAFAHLGLLEKGEELRLSILKTLQNNDSYNYFDKVDGLFKTGPTNTNVCDYQMMLLG